MNQSDPQNKGSRIVLIHRSIHSIWILILQLCKVVALSRPEIQCKCHKYNPSNEKLFKGTYLTRNICENRFKKKNLL